MASHVLSEADREQFVELGWCRVPGCFTESAAAVVRAQVWDRMRALQGVREEDRSTWPAFFNLEEHIRTPEVIATFTDRLATAIEELEGVGRWEGFRQWGLWPINFGLDSHVPYQYPNYGWHVDGNWFRHTLDAHRQGLLVIGLFSDIEPRGGGTLLAQGSHIRTAHLLAANPAGLTHRELFSAVLSEPIGNIVECTGATGDVILGHPFLFHSRSPNHSGRIRFMSNTEAPLKAPLQLDRADGNYSVLEQSIRSALARQPPVPRDPIRVCF